MDERIPAPSADTAPEPPASPAPEPDTLSPRVRAQVVSLASEAISRMPAAQVPASLRKSASFAPARRAKLVGRQIVDALHRDDDFRTHLAAQVRALVPDAAAALAGEEPAGDAAGAGRPRDAAAEGAPPDRVQELVQRAAVAYLVRPDDWSEVVHEAADAETEAAEARQSPQSAAAVERLSAQLEQARAEAREQRDRLRAQVESLKADNTTLRRTLGQTRQELNQARNRLDAARDELADVQREGEVALREAEAERRRLRARITQLEADSAAIRRVARDDRDAEVVRLRLLLDTMVEAANGLRRELALPASSGLPADAVPSVEPGVGSGASQVGRALLSHDPILLRRLLELPRVHLIVDGYNVSKEAWPTASLEQQRARLVAGLAGLVAGKGVETTVVFDGADLLHVPVVSAPRGVRVRFSPPGVTADDVIRQMVNAEPSGRPVVVVSTDREVAESVSKLGARSVSSVAMVAVLGR